MEIHTTLIRLPVVKHRTGLSRSSIYKRVREGTFPRPVSLGGRAVAWLEQEVASWIAARVAESRRAPAPSGSGQPRTTARHGD